MYIEFNCTQNIKLYHFVHTILSVPFCPIPFCPYTILSIPFCPYHFVRYHFVPEPFQHIVTLYPSIIYFLRLIPQVGENGAAREPCQRRRPTPKACRRAKSPGREGGRDSRECCCQSPVRGEGLRRRPKACRRAKSRGREGIAGERE